MCDIETKELLRNGVTREQGFPGEGTKLAVLGSPDCTREGGRLCDLQGRSYIHLLHCILRGQLVKRLVISPTQFQAVKEIGASETGREK